MQFEHYISKNQIDIIRQIGRGEEGAHMLAILTELEQAIDNMPKTYETDGLGDAAPVTLHYFLGGSDWFIIEKDAGCPDDDAEDLGKQYQTFGFVCLNGDRQSAELGYIPVQELIENNVELDLYYKPEPIGIVRARFSC